MDKIKALMEQMGFSPDLSSELVKSINEHVDSEKKRLNEELDAKLKKAREVCLQAVNEEKARLARGIEVFLEGKMEKIERARTQQMAIEESESSNQLKRVKALIENVDLSKVDDKNGVLQAANRKISLLEHKTERLAKEKQEVFDKLRISNDIAARAHRKAMMLESRDKAAPTSKVEAPVISESKQGGKGGSAPAVQSLNEEKKAVAPAASVTKPVKTSANTSITPSDIAEMM